MARWSVPVTRRGLRKQFAVKGRVIDALAEINLDVRAGEFFCIVGPSGCGKTTLLRILAGLEFETDEEIHVFRDSDRDGNIGLPSGGSGRGSRAARPLNSMVLQEQSIFPWMSVRDNVAFGLKAAFHGAIDTPSPIRSSTRSVSQASWMPCPTS